MCSMYLATLGNVYNVSVHHFQLGMSSLIHDSWLVGFKRNYNPLQHTITHYSWVRQFSTNLCRDVSISSCRHTQIMEHISLFLFRHNFISGSSDFHWSNLVIIRQWIVFMLTLGCIIKHGDNLLMLNIVCCCTPLVSRSQTAFSSFI